MKTQAKSLICEHEITKPKLVIEASRNSYGHFQGTKMALCCAVCGCRVPETSKYFDRQIAA
jgi:hypothetical protein